MLSSLSSDVIIDKIVPFMDRKSVACFAGTNKKNAEEVASDSAWLEDAIAVALRADDYVRARELIDRAMHASGNWRIKDLGELRITPENMDVVYALLGAKFDVARRILVDHHRRGLNSLAEMGQTDAMFIVGNEKRDMNMVRRAYDNGHMDAALTLWVEQGDLNALLSANNRGHARAPYYLSQFELANEIAHLQTGVARGDAWAMFVLSERYARGRGVRQSVEQSRDFFERAIRTEPLSPLAWDTCITRILENHTEAFDRLWFGHAHGNFSCSHTLALYLSRGDFVDKDVKTAVDVLESVIKTPVWSRERDKCQILLADIIVQGEIAGGGPGDIQRALSLYNTSMSEEAVERITRLLDGECKSVNDFFEKEGSKGDLYWMCLDTADKPGTPLDTVLAIGRYLESEELYSGAYLAFYHAARRNAEGATEMARMRSLGKVNQGMVERLTL